MSKVGETRDLTVFERLGLRLLGFKQVSVKQDAGRIITCFRPFPATDITLIVNTEGRTIEIPSKQVTEVRAGKKT